MQGGKRYRAKISDLLLPKMALFENPYFSSKNIYVSRCAVGLGRRSLAIPHESGGIARNSNRVTPFFASISCIMTIALYSVDTVEKCVFTQ